MRSLKAFLRPAWHRARSFALRGSARFCPLCGGSFRSFLPKGNPPRPNAMCPGCSSLERHRLLAGGEHEDVVVVARRGTSGEDA